MDTLLAKGCSSAQTYFHPILRQISNFCFVFVCVIFYAFSSYVVPITSFVLCIILNLQREFQQSVPVRV